MSSVRDARDEYLSENGFTLASYTAAWGDASFFGMKLQIPNTRARARAIAQHDLHHVATGFGTDFAGEGEISAWEIAAGLPESTYVAAIICLGFTLGMLVAPRRTVRAFAAGREARSLFRDKVPYDDLLTMSVAELRRHVGVADRGLVIARGLHSRAPARTDRPTTA